MKKVNAIIPLIFSVFYIQSVMAAGIEGRWITIDDKTGKKRSVVNLTIEGDRLSGTVVEIFKQPGDTGVCEKCPGPFKGKPIVGLRIMWGLKPNGANAWGGGKILDPKTGTIYDVKITSNGDKLEVRGFVGVSMLGRTQQWVRK